MKRKNQPWLEHEDKMLKQLKDKGVTYEEAAEILQRSVESVRQRKYRKGYRRSNKPTTKKTIQLEQKAPTKDSKHIKQTNPNIEVTLFWGLVKYKKA